VNSTEGRATVATRGSLVDQDVHVRDAGSIFVLTPISARAKEWFEENIADDGSMWGRDGYVVERNYVGAIFDGLLDEGFKLAG
jgi:hypothetical protein